VGVSLVISDKSGRANGVDLAVGAAFLLLVALPISSLSWVATTASCLYLLASTNGASTRQGAVILLATTGPILWIRLLFKFFANPILNVDAFLVSWMLGTKRSGNMVEFADHSGELASNLCPVLFAGKRLSRDFVPGHGFGIGGPQKIALRYFVVFSRLRLGDCSECCSYGDDGSKRIGIRSGS
jgi:hypothetical protein